MASRNQNWNCAGKFAGAKGPCVGPATLRCGSCGAPNYCSRPHQIAHWKEHQYECGRMAQQMAKAADLVDFPFAFTAEVTQLVNEGAVTLCSFLEKRRLHLKGLWQGECKCADSMFTSSYPAEEYVNCLVLRRAMESTVNCKLNLEGVLDAFTEWQLPSSMCPCTDPAKRSGEPLGNWTDYSVWRELSFDSPVSILLHWPLTLYYAFRLISECLPTIKTKVGNLIHVHYLGPEKELQILPVFAELRALLPGTHVHIDMIGPAVPKSRDGEVLELPEYPKCLDADCICKSGRGKSLAGSDAETETTHRFSGHVTVKLWRGLYHDRYRDLISAPDFVVAPNAGLAAFPSWQATIKLLSIVKTPSIFSDYCEEAAELAACALSSGHPEWPTYPVQPNPFRQPFSVQDKLLNLPTYSNCFMFGIN